MQSGRNVSQNLQLFRLKAARGPGKWRKKSNKKQANRAESPKLCVQTLWKSLADPWIVPVYVGEIPRSRAENKSGKVTTAQQRDQLLPKRRVTFRACVSPKLGLEYIHLGLAFETAGRPGLRSKNYIPGLRDLHTHPMKCKNQGLTNVQWYNCMLEQKSTFLKETRISPMDHSNCPV